MTPDPRKEPRTAPYLTRKEKLTLALTALTALGFFALALWLGHGNGSCDNVYLSCGGP